MLPPLLQAAVLMRRASNGATATLAGYVWSKSRVTVRKGAGQSVTGRCGSSLALSGWRGSRAAEPCAAMRPWTRVAPPAILPRCLEERKTLGTRCSRRGVSSGAHGEGDDVDAATLSSAALLDVLPDADGGEAPPSGGTGGDFTVLWPGDDPATVYGAAATRAAASLFRPRGSERPKFLLGTAWGNRIPSYGHARAKGREVAFYGRSNVGKSTLLNAVLGTRKPLARTSKTPGRTQQVNLFAPACGEHALVLVDLPGYGYARAPASEVRKWGAMSRAYVEGRAASGHLRHGFVLIDARRGVDAKDEAALLMFQRARVPHSVVVTKADKLSQRALAGAVQSIRLALPRSGTRKSGPSTLDTPILVVSAGGASASDAVASGVAAVRVAAAKAVGALDSVVAAETAAEAAVTLPER